jgi:hypothetical protein
MRMRSKRFRFSEVAGSTFAYVAQVVVAQPDGYSVKAALHAYIVHIIHIFFLSGWTVIL